MHFLLPWLCCHINHFLLTCVLSYHIFLIKMTVMSYHPFLINMTVLSYHPFLITMSVLSYDPFTLYNELGLHMITLGRTLMTVTSHSVVKGRESLSQTISHLIVRWTQISSNKVVHCTIQACDTYTRLFKVPKLYPFITCSAMP